MNLHAPLLLLILTAGLAGCLPADGDDDDDSAGAGDRGVRTEDQGDGSFVTVVDARDDARWRRLDLESGAEVADDSPEWDLGFLRFNIATRVEVAELAGVDFDALTVAPADGYRSDDGAGDPADMETMPGYALDLWYDYDHTTHVLRARDVVYVVRSSADNYFKLQLQDYYDDAGTSGYVTLRWAAVAPPP